MHRYIALVCNTFPCAALTRCQIIYCDYEFNTQQWLIYTQKKFWNEKETLTRIDYI